MQRVKSNAEAFALRTEWQGECLVWIGYRDKHGYGQMRNHNNNPKLGEAKYGYAHRVYWEDNVGPIPAGFVLDHQCYNPPCVLPAHLKAATQAENVLNRKGAQRNSQSGLRGVSWQKDISRWRARIQTGGVKLCDSTHLTAPEAHRAVQAALDEWLQAA